MLEQRSGRIAAAVLVSAVLGVCAGCASSSSSSSTSTPSSTSSPSPSPSAAGSSASGGAFAGHTSGTGSNARSGPAAGGSVGTVASVSASGFTLTTSTGQKVTVDEASATTYQDGSSPASASAVTAGKQVLVLGTTSSTTITASQVTVQPAGYGDTSSTATQVIPFKRGEQSPSKTVGQIPSSYTQGSGTIVSGTVADDATEAALAAYPGAIVDRVVKLSNGEYEVHYIGVNWPHHVFVSQDFKVVGAG